MRKITLFALLLFTLTAVFTQNSSLAQNSNWRDKVDSWVLETAVPANTPATQTEPYPTTEFLVQLQAQADLSGADLLSSKEEKGRYVYEQLTAVAGQTQPALIQELENLGVPYKPFWISNMIWVQGDIFTVQTLALRDDVAHLYANPTVAQTFTSPDLSADVLPTDYADYADLRPSWADLSLFSPRPPRLRGLLTPTAITAWDNIGYVGAKDVWAMGYTGQGVVIGGQDTGYEWAHDALKDTYRGWDGVTADHNYNWHDAWNTAVNACPANSQEPCDDNSHGTHTMGTMVGNLNDIGMAPDAQWIGCRNMTGGNGTPASYTDCYQWFIAPTDLSNANADPSKAPDVINNSWSCPPSEGCNAASLATVVANVRAAGIVTVHSAGNAGSTCGTINAPAAIFDESFTVGATSIENNQIAGFSSRGPITVDGSNRMKPDISAPGVAILSATLNNLYSEKSGTSMASPHVAGLVALLISARPYLRGNVDAIEQIIQDTAVPLTTTQSCGTDTATSIPNNVFGYGRINALQTINTLIFTNKLYFPILHNE